MLKSMTMAMLVGAALLAGCCSDCEDGYSCWDLNSNHKGDLAEDLNGDGVVDIWDCQGDKGDKGDPGDKGDKGDKGDPGDPGLSCWDLNGNGVGDPDEDINGDGKFDAVDCAGAPGSADRFLKDAEMLTIAAAYCAVVNGPESGGASAVEFPEKMTGDDACAYGPEPDLNPLCYGVVIVHNYSTSADAVDFAIFNGKVCGTEIDVFPGQKPFACCGIPAD